MSEAIKSLNVPTAPQFGLKHSGIASYLPALLPILGGAHHAWPVSRA
jgi:hypothetical protein